MMAKQEYGPCQGTGGRIVTLEHEGVNFFGDVIVSQVRPVRLLDAHDLVGKETKWITTYGLYRLTLSTILPSCP